MEAVNATLGNSPLESGEAFPPLLQLLGGFSTLTERALPQSPPGHPLLSNRSFQSTGCRAAGQGRKQVMKRKWLGR